MDIRDVRQAEFLRLYVEKKRGILNLSPRLGKTRIGIEAMRRIKGKILLAYPSIAIRNSWMEDFKKWDFNPENVVFSTYKSIHKHIGTEYGLALLDEIHSPSLGQLESIGQVLETCSEVCGLTGTLSEYTRRDLEHYTGLEVIGTYSIEEAIYDGIVSDYEIRVIECPLDSIKQEVIRTKAGGRYSITEYGKFCSLSRRIDNLEEKHQDTFAPRIRRMQLLQKSISKQAMIRVLLEKYKEERLLLFCSTTEMADSFGIPSYHSKKKEDDMLLAFCKGEGKHLAAVKMLSAGITFKPLSLGIISCVDSNSENFGQKVARFLNYEYEGKAVIYIVSSDTIVEKGWIRKALEFLDERKVIWGWEVGKEAVVS